MDTRPLRVLLVATHPVQYAAPVFKLLAQDERVETEVAYCSLQGAEAAVDKDFGVPVEWDVPLLEGYPWKLLRNWPLKPRLNSFLGLCNPGIWRLIVRGNFDAVVMYTGYRYSTFWIALIAAKSSGARFIFGTDAHSLAPRDSKDWKTRAKRLIWPRLFGLADVVIVPSSGGIALMRSLGIPREKIVLTPYCVDNAWWIEQSERVDRAEVRKKWNIPEDAVVVLFCAKLQDWKRPQDLLRAFGTLRNFRNFPAYLVFAGDGAQRPPLEEEVKASGLADRVRFLGFVNQTRLPEVYTASDLLVLPSAYEPFGVVVNEAMLCNCAVIVSDQVGARFDLVRDGEAGFVVPVGDIQTLARRLESLLRNPGHLQDLRKRARTKMAEWSPRANIEAFFAAVCKPNSRVPS
jgi:glycosyltransferase involved in cell wall biosynthesis